MYVVQTIYTQQPNITSVYSMCQVNYTILNLKDGVTVILLFLHPYSHEGIVLLYAVWGLVQRLKGNNLLVVGLTFVQ